MMEILADLDRIRAYRAIVLRRLENGLIRFRCRATVEDIETFIYEREEGRAFGEYISQLIAVFNPSEAELDDAVSIVQDAWNYLPHRVYGGRSPAEVMLGLDAKKHPRARPARRKSRTTEISYHKNKIPPVKGERSDFDIIAKPPVIAM
jgi:hypothetical protein